MVFHDQLKQWCRYMLLPVIILGTVRCTKVSNEETDIMRKAVYEADAFINARACSSPSINNLWVAGTGALGFTNGPVAVATMRYPNSVAVDAVGNVYFSDKDNHSIRRISTTGSVVTIAGNGTAGFINGTGAAARFNSPMGIDIDNVGNIYVADFGNHAIRKVTPAGVVTTVAGGIGAGMVDGLIAVAKFNGPMDVACDSMTSNLYVLDANNFRARAIKQASKVWTIAGGATGTAPETGPALSVRLINPKGIDYNPTLDEVLIADVNKIKRLYAGNVSILATDALPYGQIKQVKSDREGNVYYTTDAGVGVPPYYVRVYERAAANFINLGGGPTGYVNGAPSVARYNNPWGLCVNKEGTLVYLADVSNNRIRKITITCP